MMSWLPENVSTYGGQIDYLFYLIYYITAAALILVTVLMVAFLIIYRQREGRKAVYTHGNTALELTWTVIPAVILLMLSFMSISTWGEIKIYAPPAEYEVRVVGKQFNWDVFHPGPDGKLDTEDDIKIENEVHVPVDKVVHVQLQASDVIHSFFVPSFRVKQDAVPGRNILVWFEVTKPGKYELPCAELCGFGHSGMLGWVIVHTPEDFEKFLKENQEQG